MRATAWNGGTFGVRVGKANARRFFDPGHPIIQVEIDGTCVIFSLSETFWTTCPEIRGVPIRSWLQAHRLDAWLQRHPPAVELTPLGDNRYKLSQI